MNVDEFLEELKRHGQEHLLRFHGEIDDEGRQSLVNQIRDIDFAQLSRLMKKVRSGESESIDFSLVGPIRSTKLPSTADEHESLAALKQKGLDALKAGRVAVVLVAGGQGSRLGFDKPKGMFPIGPVRGTSLFQIHAEKILAWSRKSGHAIPLLIMTSPINHEDTVAFFRENRNFGLADDQVRFFTQGTMPAVDLQTGRVLLEDKGRLFTSPNGHGGTLLALRSTGLLDELVDKGIDLISYFQIDNPFVEVIDPVFIGLHVDEGSEFSLKVIRKREPREKLGVVVKYAGANRIIEYSDLPDHLAEARDEQGDLLIWGGSIAIHVFSVPFLRRITDQEFEIPFHIARKKVAHIDEQGNAVEPREPNAVKFEMFIFDVMPFAKQVAVAETDRREEYEPVKDSEGEHSPASVQRAMVRRAGKWLKHAGIEYPANEQGESNVPIEISPLLALSKEEFADRVNDRSPVRSATYFGPDGRQRASGS